LLRITPHALLNPHAKILISESAVPLSATVSRPGNRGAPELVGHSAAIARVRDFLDRAAVQQGCVLITAEAGTIVADVAEELHCRSREASGPFVTVDCRSDVPGRVERVLFGAAQHDGAIDLEWASAESAIALACGGTLFLHDVGELPAAAQGRLARVLRDGQFRVAGRLQPAGFRLVSSAPAAIEDDVRTHRFRPDLFRRLAVTRIDVPPLRDRAEDVPALAVRVLADIAAAGELPVRSFTQSALALLAALAWPGNLSELEDVIRHALGRLDPDATAVQIEHLLPALHLHGTPAPFVPAGKLREARLRFEREYIAAVLQHHRWRMAEAAETLGMQRPNLYRKARQLGIPIARLPE
jgi:two-component system nitrogen regulation response regulator NtrX